MQKQAAQLIQQHLQMNPTKWDDNIKVLRNELKELGFYLLPLNVREQILKQAKNN